MRKLLHTFIYKDIKMYDCYELINFAEAENQKTHRSSYTRLHIEHKTLNTVCTLKKSHSELIAALIRNLISCM